MRAVVQRVRTASVETSGEIVARIGPGLLILLGAREGDNSAEVRYLADKITHLRIFEDGAGKMNRSILDIGGEALAVSQFTLFADTRKGRRPSFNLALEPSAAEKLYEEFGSLLRAEGLRVETGEFGAKMLVGLQNDGPVTIIVDTPANEKVSD
ncbi:MAG: D-aminoacyl-tRNA deacylase [Candidatus Zixiibacteriota bacterium]